MSIFKNKLVSNERGSTMIFALIIVVVMTVIGFFLLDDSVTESKITRNHAVYKANFYRSEGAVKEVERIFQDLLDSGNKQELNPNTSSNDTPVKIYVSDDDDISYNASKNIPGGESEIIFEGYASGSNIDITEQTHVYSYKITGLGSTPETGEGLVRIEAQCRKRF